MPPPKKLLVEEWERIPLVSRPDGLTPEEAGALELTAVRAGATNLFRWSRNAVTPQNWLGTIRTRHVELALVPKGWRSVPDDVRARLQSNLVMLAAQSVGLRVHPTGAAGVKPEPLLSEQLLRLFIQFVGMALRRRVVRSYRTRSQVSVQLRGSLRFPAQILVRLVSPTQYATRSTELSWDNAYNRVLAAACDVIAKSGREDLRESALWLMTSLRITPNWSLLPADRSRASRMQVGELHLHCLRLAEAIIDLRTAGLFLGARELGSQLVASDRLWEDGITSLILRNSTRRLVPQPSGHFAFRRVSGGGPPMVLEVRPDVLGLEPEPVIIDAKWKLLDATAPRVDRSDLHQVLAYARHFGAGKVILVYPCFEAGYVSSQAVTVLRTSTPPIVDVEVVLIPLCGEPWHVVDAIRHLLD